MQITLDHFNQIGVGNLPGYLGIVITLADKSEFVGELKIIDSLLAPNGFLHAGTVVTLADTCAGYGCLANLPPEATGFTTIELKSNFLGTALKGALLASAKPLHLGKTTQVWDAAVSHKESGKTIAVFRCTQMILYSAPRG
jgi:1,4-dihydroxy-2-naphthoyl-CoA hydrolase